MTSFNARNAEVYWKSFHGKGNLKSSNADAEYQIGISAISPKLVSFRHVLRMTHPLDLRYLQGLLQPTASERKYRISNGSIAAKKTGSLIALQGLARDLIKALYDV